MNKRFFWFLIVILTFILVNVAHANIPSMYSNTRATILEKTKPTEELRKNDFRNKLFDKDVKKFIKMDRYDYFNVNEVKENYFLTDKDRVFYTSPVLMDRMEARDRGLSLGWLATKKVIKYHIVEYFKDPKDEWIRKVYRRLRGTYYKMQDMRVSKKSTTRFNLSYLTEADGLEFGMKNPFIKSRAVFYLLDLELMLTLRKDISDLTYTGLKLFARKKDLVGTVGYEMQKEIKAEITATYNFGDSPDTGKLLLALNYRF